MHVHRTTPWMAYRSPALSIAYTPVLTPCRCDAPFSRYSPGGTPMLGTISRFHPFRVQILHVKATGKLTFSRACHVPTRRPTDMRQPVALSHSVISAVCKFEPPATNRLTCRREQLHPPHDGTDRQTDRQTDFVPLVSKRQATLSLALLSEIHILFVIFLYFEGGLSFTKAWMKLLEILFQWRLLLQIKILNRLPCIITVSHLIRI